MRFDTRLLHYPDGDTQEASGSVPYGVLLDVNGRRLPLPLDSPQILAYRVFKVSTEETRNETITHYYLEQVFPGELRGYAG